MSVQISCATDAELQSMLNKSSYTTYYKQLIQAEITKRDKLVFLRLLNKEAQ